jgi:hypothetical protein
MEINEGKEQFMEILESILHLPREVAEDLVEYICTFQTEEDIREYLSGVVESVKPQEITEFLGKFWEIKANQKSQTKYSIY